MYIINIQQTPWEENHEKKVDEEAHANRKPKNTYLIQ